MQASLPKTHLRPSDDRNDQISENASWQAFNRPKKTMIIDDNQSFEGHEMDGTGQYNDYEERKQLKKDKKKNKAGNSLTVKKFKEIAPNQDRQKAMEGAYLNKQGTKP